MKYKQAANWHAANFRKSCEPFQDRKLFYSIKRDCHDCQIMKSIVVLGFVCVILQAVAGSPCETESAPCECDDVNKVKAFLWKDFVVGLETVVVECEAGKEFKYQCKQCNCDENGHKATCPRWIRCCKKDEIWSTNSCNLCFCDENYRRICKIVPCTFRKH